MVLALIYGSKYLNGSELISRKVIELFVSGCATSLNDYNSTFLLYPFKEGGAQDEIPQLNLFNLIFGLTKPVLIYLTDQRVFVKQEKIFDPFFMRTLDLRIISCKEKLDEVLLAQKETSF